MPGATSQAFEDLAEDAPMLSADAAVKARPAGWRLGTGYLDRPAPDPAQFGLPTEDDGSRDDLLLSGNLAMPTFEPDADALRASSVRIVSAIPWARAVWLGAAVRQSHGYSASSL